MHVSAHTCREQEAIQRAKALSEPLENRRKIALAAANAWAAAALATEQRERQRGSQSEQDADIAREFAREAALPTPEADPGDRSPRPEVDT